MVQAFDTQEFRNLTADQSLLWTHVWNSLWCYWRKQTDKSLFIHWERKIVLVGERKALHVCSPWYTLPSPSPHLWYFFSATIKFPVYFSDQYRKFWYPSQKYMHSFIVFESVVFILFCSPSWDLIFESTLLFSIPVTKSFAFAATGGRLQEMILMVSVLDKVKK